jgi:hypothetical protein
MARIYGAGGLALTQSACSAIAGTVQDITTGAAHTDLTMAVVNVVFNSYQPWPEAEADTTGYNFRYTLDAAYLTTSGHRYKCLVTITLTDLSVTTLEYEILVEAPDTTHLVPATHLSISYYQLQQEVAAGLGYTRDQSRWTNEQSTVIDACVQSGYRQLLWASLPGKEGPVPVRWSFLSPAAAISTANGQSAYDLPLDFGGNLTGLTPPVGSASSPLTQIKADHLTALQTGSPLTGQPYYFAVIAKTSTGALRQVWSLLLYPTPTAIQSLSYHYDISPQPLSDAYPFALGPAAHSETLLESCLAIAEERLDDKSDLHRKRFQELLAASVVFDATMQSSEVTDTWPVATTATTLDLTYTDFLRHTGQFLGYGWDSGRWTRDQTAVADDLVQAGWRQFCRPPIGAPPPSDNKNAPPAPPHRWSFMVKKTTLNIGSPTVQYDMATDFGGELIGDMTYPSPALAANKEVGVKLVSDDLIRDLYQGTITSVTDAPQYVSISPKTGTGVARQVWQAHFYPIPNASFTLTYQYYAVPLRLTAAAPYPLGGVDHAETILASCLAAAEERMRPESQTFRQRFQARLAASIQADAKAPPDDTSWPQGDSGPATLDMTYTQLLQRTGRELGLGWNSDHWNTEETRRTDLCIQGGMRTFLFPPPIGREKYAHEWSFLRPATTITTIAPYTTGTITVVDGVVTLAGVAVFPAWAATGFLSAGTYSMLAVNTRNGNTQLTLDDLTIDIAAGTTYSLAHASAYDLPTDYAAMEGPLTFQPSVTIRPVQIRVVSSQQVEGNLAAYPYSGRPQLAAIRPKAVDQTTWTKYEILFFPVPDDDYELTYHYRLNIQTLTADGLTPRQYPPGAQAHGETILEACLAAAERMRDGREGTHTARFHELLTASISHDRQASAPPSLGYMGDNSDAEGWIGWDPHGQNTSVTTINGVAW